MKRTQALSRKFRLERCEGKLIIRVSLKDKLDEAAAEMAHAVKQD